MLVFLLHSMKLLFTKPIPPNPAPSKIIPIISETLYIYLIGFHTPINWLFPDDDNIVLFFEINVSLSLQIKHS